MSADLRAVEESLGQRFLTLFIGGIDPIVTEQMLESILRSAGSLVQWRRVQTDKVMPWGFAEYGDAESVLRALRMFEKLRLNEKELKVVADEETKEFLRKYDEKVLSLGLKRDDQRYLEQLDEALRSVNSIIERELDLRRFAAERVPSDRHRVRVESRHHLQYRRVLECLRGEKEKFKESLRQWKQREESMDRSRHRRSELMAKKEHDRERVIRENLKICEEFDEAGSLFTSDRRRWSEKRRSVLSMEERKRKELGIENSD